MKGPLIVRTPSANQNDAFPSLCENDIVTINGFIKEAEKRQGELTLLYPQIYRQLQVFAFK